MTVNTKTDVARYRSFGMRVAEELIDDLRTSTHPGLEFPARTYNIDEFYSHGTSTQQHHRVTVKVRSIWGTWIELEIWIKAGTRTTTRAEMKAQLYEHGSREWRRSFVYEDEAGVISFEGMAEYAPPLRVAHDPTST